MRTVEWPQREAFIAHLDELKRRRNIDTDIALADAAGISHTSISSWRSGRQRPSLPNLYKLAEALAVPAHTLAQVAGLVDPARFGQAAPSEPVDPNEELIITQPGLTEEQRKHLLRWYRGYIEEGRQRQRRDVESAIELMRRAE